jgi:hypothetical protein
MTDEDLSDLATCHWRSSGLKFHRSNDPRVIYFQRYCYPNGDKNYCDNKGASVWTMVSKHLIIFNGIVLKTNICCLF